MSQCMADEGRWEDGLKLCEAAMGILASAVHLRLSTWKVLPYAAPKQLSADHNASPNTCRLWHTDRLSIDAC